MPSLTKVTQSAPHISICGMKTVERNGGLKMLTSSLENFRRCVAFEMTAGQVKRISVTIMKDRELQIYILKPLTGTFSRPGLKQVRPQGCPCGTKAT